MLPDERQKHRMAEMKPVMDDYWDFLSLCNLFSIKSITPSTNRRK